MEPGAGGLLGRSCSRQNDPEDAVLGKNGRTGRDAVRYDRCRRSGAPVPSEVMDYISEADQAEFRANVMPRIRAGKNCDRELRLRNFSAGADVPALYTIFPVRDEAGELLGYGVVTKDITEQKEEEAKRVHMMARPPIVSIPHNRTLLSAT